MRRVQIEGGRDIVYAGPSTDKRANLSLRLMTRRDELTFYQLYECGFFLVKIEQMSTAKHF